MICFYKKLNSISRKTISFFCQKAHHGYQWIGKHIIVVYSASYHQSSNWAVYGFSSYSWWSTSQLVQHQPVFTCTSREILFSRRDLVVGVCSLLFVLHRMWHSATWRDTSPGLPKTDVNVDVDRPLSPSPLTTNGTTLDKKKTIYTYTWHLTFGGYT